MLGIVVLGIIMAVAGLAGSLLLSFFGLALIAYPVSNWLLMKKSEDLLIENKPVILKLRCGVNVTFIGALGIVIIGGMVGSFSSGWGVISAAALLALMYVFVFPVIILFNIIADRFGETLDDQSYKVIPRTSVTHSETPKPQAVVGIFDAEPSNVQNPKTSDQS